jgi:hypothetical protein
VTGTTSSATLTLTQAGSIVIDANEAGGLGTNGTYYDAASQVQLTLTIGKASEAITFTPPTSPVVFSSGLTVNLSAIGGGASTPVVFTVDAASTGAGTVSTTTVTGNTSSATLTVTQAGTIVLDANQAADVNYLAAPQVQQVLVVNQASQTITFTPVTAPLHYIVSCSVITLCSTIQIQATGGATDNLIAISPDPKNGVAFTILSSSVNNGITTTTIALVPNQTLPSPANLVLDGNQQGNANYSAASAAEHRLGQSRNAGWRRHIDAQRDGGFRIRGHVRFKHHVGLHGQWFDGHACECDLRQRLHNHGYTARRQPHLCRGRAVDADIRSQRRWTETQPEHDSLGHLAHHSAGNHRVVADHPYLCKQLCG